MSKINLRLYADQVYGLSSSFLNEYISPSIEKDSFISKFKEGLIKLENIAMKKEIIIHKTLLINSLLLNSLELNVPDENSHLIINIDGIKTTLILSEINEDYIEEMIISQRRELKKKFIKDLFYKVTKKSDSSSFLEGLIENLLEKIVNGLTIKLKEIEIKLKFDNIIFTIKINNVDLVIENKELKIDLKGINISYIDESNVEEIVIHKTDIMAKLIFNSEENNCENGDNDNNIKNEALCELEINIKNIKINLSRKLIKYVFNIINLYRDIKYYKIYHRYKKLIQFHRPKIDNNNNNNYKLLWHYAIKTVIKLRKFGCYDNYKILELINSSQNKIIKNEKNVYNFLLPSDINILNSTREEVEKKILDSKESLANKFFSFFASKKEEKTLTEEEKAILEDVYKEENLEKYISQGKFEDNIEKEIIKKIKKYLSSFTININIEKFNILFNNEKISENNYLINQNIYLANFFFGLKLDNNILIFNINAMDIGKNENESFGINNNNSQNMDYFIKFSYDNLNNLSFIVGNKLIEVPENILNLILCYTINIIQNIILFNERSLFHKIKKKNEITKTKKVNKIIIPYLPSFTIIANDNNKINVDISNYSIKNNNISFNVKIKDLYTTIMDNYQFNVIMDEDNNKYNINLDKTLNIIINKDIIEKLIINYKNINNLFYEENFNINKRLYNFKFIKYINNYDNILQSLNNNVIWNMKEFNLIIKENKIENSIKLNNFSFKCENKHLSLNVKDIFINIDILSFQPIFDTFQKMKFLPNNCGHKNIKNLFKELIKLFEFKINHFEGYLYIEHEYLYYKTIVDGIMGKSDEINNHIINYSIKYIKLDSVSSLELKKIFECKNMKFNGRIDYKCDLIFNLNLESPFMSIIFFLKTIEIRIKFIKYFLQLDIIYEIIINNMQTELYEEYLEDGVGADNTKISDLSFNITNYYKKEDNMQIDLTNLEQYGLNYNLESFKNIIMKVRGQNINFFPTQKDVSLLFFSILLRNDNINISELINNLFFDINLHRIRIGFHPQVDYNKELFNIYFGDLLLNLNMQRSNIKNFHFCLNKFEINYFEENNIENKIIPLPLLNNKISYIEKENNIDNDNKGNKLLLPEELKQIVIKKDINNKINININRINIVFRYEVILSIFLYFKDLSVFDLINHHIKKNKEKNAFKKEDEKNIDIQIFLSELQLQFPINYFHQKNNIEIYFNQLDLAYIKIFDNCIKDHRIRISLNNIRINNYKRKILYTKNEYLLFVLNIKDDNYISLICNSLFNNMIINISYKDIILFCKIILDIQNINKTLFGTSIISLIKERNLKKRFRVIKSKNDDTSILQKFNSIIAEINIESINITFLEDYTTFNIIDYKCINDFNPFLNINLFNSKLNYELSKNKKERYPNAKFNSNYNLLINYYNYLIKKWEPITEDLIIKLEYILKADMDKLVDDYTIEINKLILNISDIFVNILLIKLNDWIYKLKEQFSYLISSINYIKNKELNNDGAKENNDRIIKYIIYNYTETDIIINCFNKKNNLKISDKLVIEYSDEEISEINNLNENYIIISFSSNNNSKDKIILFPEDYGIKQYYIQNKERSIYIQTKLNKDKNINIFIYNPIILKNKTNYSFDIHLNGDESIIKTINLQPNSSIGMPKDFILNKDTNFQIELKKENNKNIDINSLTDLIYLKDIILNDSTEKICKDILFKNNSISLSLISKTKLDNLRFIIISYKYCIINCLPCSLFISQNPENDNNKQNEMEKNESDVEIKKNSYYNLDNISLLTESNSIKLRIKVLSNYFYSKLSLKRSETKKKIIKFTNLINKDSLVLPILIKETFKTKVIIIYSEYILYNSSGIELNISSQDNENNKYFYNIGNNINLISSEIKNKNPNISIKTTKNIFSPNNFLYEEILKSPLYEFTLHLEEKSKKSEYNFDLIINKNISHLWCENDKNNYIKKITEDLDEITIYRIVPKYNIVNYSMINNSRDNNINLILKTEKHYHMGINFKTMEEIREINNYYILDKLSLNSLYTVCIKEKLYNIEVRRSKNGYKDIFVFDDDLNHSQVVVENRTNFDIYLKQKKYEKHKQEIKKNETQILKIYEQTNQNFSVQIDNKLYYLNFNEIGKKQIVNNLYLKISSIRNIKKIVFYMFNLNHYDYIQKSKSVIYVPKISYNNLKMNFQSNKLIKINIIVNNINISIIGQNKKQIIQKNNNNRIYNYERNEIALLFINDFQCGIILSSKKDIFPNKNIYQIKLNITISNFEIYDLLTNNNNISCLFINSSSPLLQLYSEMNYDFDKNRAKVVELINKIGDIRLNIAPGFLHELYNFINNIIINIRYHNKKVDKLFTMNDIDTFNSIDNINYMFNPMIIIIDKIEISKIKIVFKLKKEGLDTLPKLIIDAINYLKCFPFFAIDKETKTILESISLKGPYKDINTLINNLKLLIITQLSKAIVNKVIHPSTHEIKDNINDMIGYENKTIHKNIKDENISRIINKRTFLGKNHFIRKYNKNEVIVMQKIKEELEKYKNRYVIEIIEDKNLIIVLFEDCLLYISDCNIAKTIIYINIKNINLEKNKIKIKCVMEEKNEEVIFELKDASISQKLYTFLMNVSNI